MAPLIVLLGSFGILFGVNRFLLNDKWSLSPLGRISLALMLILTGAAHFTQTDLMVEMMPDFMPLKRETVYLTGVIEFLAAAGLIIKKVSRLTAILLIVFFLAVLPANIVGSLKQVNLGGMENGAAYLFFRVPLQISFILWTYYFGVRINK
ncbi:MAG TPA: DoxX family protein [Pyrinomonadaceae bacterium]|nr:DoxX family protein [Pyrinomonadaceae bacterium]